MPSKTYIYVIAQGDKQRLVRATNGPRAKSFAASDILVRLASQDDLERMLGQGVKVEDSTTTGAQA